MEITIYANYGVLAHEYRVVYTADNPHVHADHADQLIVEIPEKYQPYTTVEGSIALVINGTSYMLGEVIDSTAADNPCIAWYNHDGLRHIERLAVVKGAHHD